MNTPVPKGRARNHPKHHLISEPEFVLDASTFRQERGREEQIRELPVQNLSPGHQSRQPDHRISLRTPVP
jgi:hypothetical protein